MMELLAPAGSLESLKAAVNAGADAVYIGGSQFGARAYADNPGEEQLLRGMDYCHLRGRSLYLTVNTLLKNQELEERLYEFLLPYYREGLDGIIVQDMGVVRFLQKHFPMLPVHASTQMTVTGVDGALFLKDLGISRIVTARELSLEEVRAIIRAAGLEVEVFVHGAMCYSYSGQCLLSSMIGGRSGNRGRCAQPCRLPYTLSGRDGVISSKPLYLMSLKDMCALGLLPELFSAGIASVKIEGRMKKPEYTAGVVSVYRRYLDRIEAGERDVRVSEEDERTLQDLYSRGGFSQGYYHTANGPDMMTVNRPNHLGSRAAQIVRKRQADGSVCARALCSLSKGDVLEAAEECPGKKGPEFTVSGTVCEGDLLCLPPHFRKVSAGRSLYRTRNESLLKSLHDAYIAAECREKIKGNFIISPEKPVILRLSCGRTEAAVTGAAAQKAQKRPLTEEDIRRQLFKTGDSPFQIETLQVEMEGEVFLPVQELNRLRRDALAALEQKLLERFRRAEAPAVPDREERRPETGSGAFRLTVLVQEERQLEAVLRWISRKDAPESRVHAPDALYLDCALLFPPGSDGGDYREAEQKILRVRQAGMRCLISMPPVFRAKERRFFRQDHVREVLELADGFLVRTIDAFAFLLRAGFKKEIVADDGLYAYNREAARFWKEAGASRLTLPSELNAAELAGLDTEGCELNVYGRTLLMVTAQCLLKNTSGCTGSCELLYLTDRKKMSFPVRARCRECCNVIYNSVPLNLFSFRKEIERLHPSWLRLSFTVESAAETAAILELAADFLAGHERAPGQESGTRGHFRRGVE